jgi:trans-aconitate methyltransferase
MKTLNEVYQNHQSPFGHGDKGTLHSYIDEYERLLSPYRFNSTILEIGIYKGESLRMWEEYFIDSEVFGLEINSEHLTDMINENNHNIVIGDATNVDVLKFFGDRMFDVVIDDGSHWLEHQVKSFEIFKNRMKPNGLYVIEDIDNIDQMKSTFETLHNNIEIIDNRHIKGRYDDVLVVYKF